MVFFSKLGQIIIEIVILKNSSLQMRGGFEDNSKINFLILNENICCDPSFEPSH